MATELERLVVRIEADISQLKSGLRGAEGTVKSSSTRMSRGFAGVGRSISAVTRRLRGLQGVLIAVGGAFVTKELIQAGDTYSLLQSRLKIVTDSSQELANVTDALFDSAQRTRSAFQETADFYARLARSTEELGFNQTELLDITETINQAIITSGATAQEASAGLIQFSQGLASNTLRGDELRSVMEQLPRLARAIADGLGISIGQLRKVSQEGKLTGEEVLRAIQTQAGQIATEFAQIDRTAAQAFQQLSNSFLRAAGVASQTSGSTREVTEAIDALRAVVEDPAFQQALTGLLTFFVNIATAAAGAVRDIQLVRREFQNLVGIQPSFNVATSNVTPEGLKEGARISRMLKDAALEQSRGVTIPLPPVRAPDPLTKSQETALKSIERMVQALEDEAIVAGTAASKREELAAVLSLETAARRGDVTVSDEQLERAKASIAITQQQIKEEENLLKIRQTETQLVDENELLAKRIELFGQSEIIIERELALLEARQDLGELGVATVRDEIMERAALLQTIEAQEKAEEDLQAIKDVQITTNAELATSTLNLQGAATAFAGSISSAFEDAVIAGEDLQTVLEGLEEDIIRLLSRLLITEPLEKGLRTAVGAFEEPSAGGPGGIEGLIGGAGTALADLFGFGGPGTTKALQKDIGAEIGGAGSEFISSEDAELIFGDLSGKAEEVTETLGRMAPQIAGTGDAAESTGALMGTDLIQAVAKTIAVEGTEAATTITLTTALTNMTAAAFAATVALNAVAASGGGGALTGSALGLLGPIGGAAVGVGGGAPGLPLTSGGFLMTGSRHKGGIVGGSGAVPRIAPIAAFAGAPRLHSGGIPGLAADEVPTILQRGEEVIPRDGVGSRGDIHLHGVRDFQTFRQNMPQFRGQLAELQDRGMRKDA